MRQRSKQILTLTKPYLIVLTALLWVAMPMPAFAQRQSIVIDVLTGVAIGGYDPVSYFTGPEPKLGSPQYVHQWAGVPWYFASAANRDVFARAPEIYAPLFGGHGAMSMARGYLSDGNPQIYQIVGDRLVFFFSTGNREAFALGGPVLLARAIDNWEALPPAREMVPLTPSDGNAPDPE